MALLVTTTATENDGDTAQRSGILQIDVEDGTSPPTLTLTDSAGVEDNAIALNIGATDVSSVVISNVPTGATLNAGIDNGNGTWTLTQAELGGLTITPPADSDVDMTLTVVANGTDGSTTSGTLDVDVAADADTPTLDLTAAAGTEDTAIPLSVTADTTDGSETLSVSIADIPAGATLSYVDGNGDTQSITVTNGTADLTPDQLNGLAITPPEGSDVDFALDVTATSTDGTDTATTNGSLSVSVAADADAPTLDLTDASGSEDRAIALDIDPGLTDLDGSESLSISIGDIPAGSTLTYVDDQGATQSITVTDGSADLTADQLNGLQITPPEDYSGSFDLSVAATATEADGGDTATTSGTLTVDVAAVADEADLTVSDASGVEDTAIPLSIDAEVTDSSETLSVSISDIPDGATLTYVDSAGDTQTITVTGGSADLTADQLNGLSITPPADSNLDFQLSVNATTTDGTDSETVTSTLDVSVTGDADAPTATVQDETGTEDTWIQLNLDSALSDTDGSESLTITITDFPDGALLAPGTDNGDGIWSVTPAELPQVCILPPDDFSGEITMSLNVTATENDGDTETTSKSFKVTVEGDADAPTVTVSDASGTEDTAIPLTIDAGFTDSSETLSISISDIPVGATLTYVDGNNDTQTITVENGSADLTADQLNGLQITPLADSNEDFQLSVSATSTDGTDTATTTSTLDVSVTGDADVPTLSAELGEPTVTTSGGTETDVTISADNYSSTDSGFTVTARSIDSDGNLTDASVDNVSTGGGGFGVSGAASGPDYQLGYDQDEEISEQLIITFDNDVSDASFDFAKLYADEGGDGANEQGHYELYRDGVKVGEGDFDTDSGNTGSVSISATDGGGFDQIVFTAADGYSVSGSGDGSDYVVTGVEFTQVEGGETTVTYPLDITSGLTDIDGSETLSITVSDLPDGATLSAGTENQDGSWTLTPAELDDLEITLTGDDSGRSFDLTVAATATENDGDTETVSVTASSDGTNTDLTSDGATLDVTDASGTEDTAIALDIDAGLIDTDGSESLSITISDVPDGATLNAGTDNEDGTWTLSADDLDGLMITPPADSDVDFTLSVTATATESSTGDTSTTTGTLDVSVAADADTPTLNLSDAVGTEDNAIALSINPGLTDTDGSESLSISIGDIPTGSTLTYVDDNNQTQSVTVTEGTATLNADQLNGLQITPPDDYSGSFDLSVTATSTEADGGDTASTSGTLTVDVAGDADVPTLDLTPATGVEDNAIPLSITADTTDGSETLSVSIADIPAGATLTYVDDQGATQTITVTNGTAELTPDQLNGLAVTPPENSDVDFDLSVTATSTDGTDTATNSGSLTVSVAADADAPTLDLTDASGAEDNAIALDIDTGLTDVDGSEALSITIGDIPAGATLTYVDDQGATQEITVTEGAADLTADQLNGLSITPPADSNEDFQLSVSATTTDGTDTETVSSTLDVSVTGDADAPTLEASVGDPVDVTIGVDNVTETGGGFSVTARSLDDNGDLTDASADNIAFNQNPPGFGVAGGASGADSELGYDSGSGTSEELIVNFDEDVSTADVTFAWLNPNEDAVYEIYRDGVKVGEGLVDGGSFDQIVFTAPGQGDDFLINSIEFEANEGGDTAVQYPLDITSALTDTDGSESLSITVSDLPDGATLSAGTENTDGSWTLAAGDLEGLTMTVAGDNPGQSFDLTVAATATENDGDTETVSVTASSDGTNVDLAANGATLDVTDASGTEDTAIALDIDAGLIDTDGSETLSITISDVPNGATLNAGTDNEDGTWTLSADDLDGLMITPPADSDVDFTLSVTATATESSTGDTSTTTGTLDVSVAADADTPTLNLSDSSGLEDNAIALNIDPGLGDTDGSESLSVTISGVPDGATLSAGTENPDGTWTLTEQQLDGLTITPPDDYSGAFDLGVTATATEADDGDTATTTGTLTVDVAAVADEADLTVSDAAGTEDQAIALNIDAGVTDSSESLSITISGVPNGASLSAGTENSDGTWTLTEQQLDGLEITPPADSDADFTLTVSATTTDGADTETVTVTLDVSVAADADTPTLNLSDASGAEDNAIALNINPGLTDTDGSEALSITISDVPDGATLNAGTENPDGSWTLSAGDLNGLTITPPDDYSGSFDLSVAATATEADGGDAASTSGTLTVDVAADADAPTPDLTAASGTEDTAIPLSIDAALTDTSETLSISIGDIPTGATLTYVDDRGATQTITVENGSADLTPDQLNGPSITPPTDSNEDFQLSVSATSADGTDAATTTGTLDVSVTGDADAPTLEVSIDDGTFTSGGTPESDPETVTVADDGSLTFDGAWSYGDIAYSTGEIEISADDGGTFNLQSLELGKWGGDGIVVKAYDENGDEITSQSISMGDSYGVGGTVDFSDVTGFDGVHSIGISNPGGYIKVGDVTTTTGDADGGDAFTTYDLDVTTALTDTDGSETLSVTISDVPDGVSLSAGSDNGDGTWSVDPGDLDGLEMTVPDGTEDFSVTVSATATENDGDTETTTQTIDVGSLDTVAETPTVSVDDASGLEDGDIAITINAALSDTDGSETLSVTIGDVPTGATLSAGTDNGDGTWTIDPAELDGLSITPPADSDADFTLSVSVTATETLSGDTSTVTAPLDVSVEAVADAPTLETLDASGTEDNAIALNISSGLTDTDGSESLSITISGVPDGATLNAGTENQDGTWTLSAEDLNGLTVTPPADSDVDFTLTVSATSTDGTDTETVSGTIDVSVAADADAPTLNLSDATGTEDNAIALNISSGLTDTDGSESLSITISGVPDGATLNAGTENQDGTWTLSADDLNGLTVTPAADSDADFTLSVSATSTDGTDTETVSGTIDVSVAADADTPTLDLTDASGTEDNAIALDIDPGLTDTDGSESLSVTIGDIPDGATLTYVDGDGATQTITVTEGSATLGADQLNGLQITPPDDYSGSFDLSVTAMATEADGGDTATTTGTLTVDVAAVADEADLTVSDASGTEDQAVALDIDAGVTDASESLSITISGVPDGATLNAGTENQDGTWTLSADDLDGLTITPPADSNEDFQLSVTATTTDGADTETVTSTLDVSVTGDADAATVSVQDEVGTEDTWIQLHLDAALSDTDGSESLTITISDVPEGAQLAPGTDNGDGTWSATLEELPQVCILPPDDFSGEITMSLNVTTTENDGDTETVTQSFDVTVNGDADPATVSVTAASGTEDQAIALDIDASTADGSESLSITIGDIPDGATLAYVDDNGATQSITVENGSAELTPAQLNGLTITPLADSDADFTLSVAATTTDGSDTETVTANLPVSVAADADTPTLNLADASGSEDNAIALNIDPGLGDTDGSESLSITISGVPDGATLSAGTENRDGTWTLESGDLQNLTITPPDDYSGSFDLSVTATATTSGTITVDVAGVADEADLAVSDAIGTEDQAIALNIDAGVTDSSESMSITISGVPDGATLSAGTENQDGTWTLTEQQLDGLSVTPPADSDADFTLTVSATSTDGSDTETVSGTIDVSVAADADTPTLNLSDASGTEDNAIALNISAGVTDSSESLSVTISGVPDGATLNAGTENQDGTWTLESGDLQNLTITPPADSDADFTLSVTATSTDGSDTATTTDTIDVSVAADADAPTLSADATYSETEAVATTINVPQSVTDAAIGDNTVTVSNVPNGAALSAGTDNGDGTWTLAAGDVDGLTVTPTDGSTETMSLSFEVSGDSLASENFDSGVSGWSGGATSSGGQMKLQGNTSTSKTFDFGSEHGGQTVTISFDFDAGSGWEESGQYTDYFNVSANGTEVLDTTEADSSSHSFTVTLDENGQVNLEMSTNTTASSEYMMVDNLEITAGDDWSSTLASETVDVTPDPENLVYDLDITSALTDTDGSETLSITVDDLPDGAVLSAGTENQDGSWTLAAGDLDGLTMTVPDGSGAFNLAVSATATEADGDTNTVSASVSVAAPDQTADGVTLDTSDASGSEDQAIALDIDATLVDTDGSETVSITLSGVPDGATLNAGTENQDGTWTLEAGDLDGLTITPAADSSADFTLTVSATTTESSTGDTSTSTSTVDVSVAGVADAPELSVELGAVTSIGGEDSGGPVGSITVDNSSFESSSFSDGGYSYSASGWSVSGNAGSWDPSSSEFNDQGSSDGTHGVPDGENIGWAGWGGSMSQTVDGTFEADRSYELSVDVGDPSSSGAPPYEIRLYAGNELVGSVDQSDFPLTDQEFTTATISVNGSDFADDFAGFGGDLRIELVHSGGDSYVTFDQVELSAADIGGDDGYTRELDITSSLTDTDGSETLSITVSDVPDGVTLSAGTENPDGTWTLSSGDLDGLTMTVPADTADFDLSVSATATEADGDTNTVTSTISVTEPDLESEGVTLSTSDASGSEDRAIALDIGATLADTDGSETVSVTISGVPDGATLSSGTDNQDGTWSLESGDLSGLTVTVPSGSEDFMLNVSATATDEGGDTRTATQLVQVDTGDDGFDAGTTGTDSADTLTGSSGDDVISGDGGAGADTIDGGAGDDHVMGGDGDDFFIFGSGDGADYFNGGDGWSDTVQLEGVDGGPGGDSGWTLQVDEGTTYTETESGVEFDAEASGSIVLADGSELTFDNVEKLEW